MGSTSEQRSPAWSPPVSDGSGRDRATLKRALDLFASAGFELRGATLVDRNSGRPFTFEMVTEKDEERLALVFSQSLKRAGIAARVRVVDAVLRKQRP
jgi:peptide/nickel transport system substrate-binding protein